MNCSVDHTAVNDRETVQWRYCCHGKSFGTLATYQFVLMTFMLPVKRHAVLKVQRMFRPISFTSTVPVSFSKFKFQDQSRKQSE